MPARTPLTKGEVALKVQFGAAIRDRRKQLALTQEEFAQRVRMHRTYVAEVESGNRNVSIAAVARIAKGLGFSLPQFWRHMERTPTAGAKR